LNDRRKKKKRKETLVTLDFEGKGKKGSVFEIKYTVITKEKEEEGNDTKTKIRKTKRYSHLFSFFFEF
jgi:hypothetical protein